MRVASKFRLVDCNPLVLLNQQAALLGKLLRVSIFKSRCNKHQAKPNGNETSKSGKEHVV